MANNKTFKVSLDMKAPTAQRNEWEVVEGDNGNIIEITLTDDGEPVDLTGCLVLAVFGLPNGKTVEQDNSEADGSVTIGGTDNNIITIALKTGSFSPGKSSSGLMKCEIQVYSGLDQDTLITSAQFTFRCRRAIMNDETIATTNEYPILVELINKVQQLVSREQSDWDEADSDHPSYIRNKPGMATENDPGLVKLYNDTDSSDANKAATAGAVKKAYDTAEEARSIATDLPVNPNILDNWYFLDPINQRGKTSYTSAGYTIDRWIAGGISSVEVVSDGLKVKPTVNTTSGIMQRMIKGRFDGMTLTASVLLSDGTLLTGTGVVPSNSSVEFFRDGSLRAYLYTNQSGYDYFQLYFTTTISGDSITYVAAKLEIGDHQTLAYQDGNTWKLRDIPDKQEQLRRCQFYFYRLTTNNANEGLTIAFCWANQDCSSLFPFPPMRTTPSVSANNDFYLHGAKVTNYKVNYVPYRAFCTLDMHTYTGSSSNVGNVYMLSSPDAGATIDFSADL